MLADLSFSDKEREFFKTYQELLKKYHDRPQKLRFFLELKALEAGIEDLERTLEKFDEFLRRYLFFVSKREELKKVLPVDEDLPEVLQRYPYFVPYEVVRTYPSAASYGGIKWREPYLLAAGDDGLVRIWRFTGENFEFVKEVGRKGDGRPVYELKDDHLFYADEEFLRVFYLPSGKEVASVRLGQKPEALDLENGSVFLYRKLGPVAVRQEVSLEEGKLTFGPAEPVPPAEVGGGETDMVAVGGKLVKVKDGKVLLFKGAKKGGRPKFEPVTSFDFGRPINDLLALKGGLLVAPSGHPPALLDARTGRVEAKLEVPLNHSYRIRKHPLRDWVAVSHDQNLVSVWDAATLQPVRILESYFIDVLGLAFSPDGKLLAASGEGRDVNVWNAESWEMVKDLDLPAEGLTALAFSPDGSFLVVGASDGRIFFVRTSDWSLSGTLSFHRDAVSDLLFTPDGRRLISASWDGKVVLWDAETGEVERVIHESGDRIWRLALSEDGGFLAVAGWDGAATVYDSSAWEKVAEFVGDSEATAVAFGPDYLAIGRRNGTIEVVGISTAEEGAQEVEELSLCPAEGAVGVVSFEGGVLVLTEGGAIKLWNSAGEKVFSALLAGRVERAENLREPKVKLEVLPDTFIVQRERYLYGAKGWQNFVRVLRGLEEAKPKEEFLKEVEKPDLLKEL
ncbi:MAG: WD40 repeat domain-containing protein [Aquificae bacterium]|nr:WD40 repeat domain-containing protein [Aquificota bacterium]